VDKKIVTKESLADWQNTAYYDNDLHLYFEDTYGRWNWTEIYREGVSVCNLMFDYEIEEDSPLESVFAAVAAQAAYGAFSAVAQAIGTDRHYLMGAIEDYYENKDESLPALGYDGLRSAIEEEQKMSDDFEK